jgi:cytoskeletal protein CcmA (bactofilin family)
MCGFHDYARAFPRDGENREQETVVMSFFGSRRQPETPVRPSTSNISGAPNESGNRGDTRADLYPTPSMPQPVGFETVLGANSSLEGTLKSAANVRLDGMFTGTLEISGNVLVGETAQIHADVNARNISIAGAIRGNVSGKKVQLLRTGRVWGDISAQALTTEEGAFIDGKITMVDHWANRPADAPVTEAEPSAIEPIESVIVVDAVSEAPEAALEPVIEAEAPAETADSPAPEESSNANEASNDEQPAQPNVP